MPTSNLKTLNQVGAASLLLLSLLGFWGTWGIGGRTGFLGLIKSTLDAPVQLLPVVKEPVKHSYTFIPPVDALVRRLNVFLWSAVDGTWPGLCLVAWEFSGQFSATWMIAGLEGLRQGNRGKIISYLTIIGTLSQAITYGTIVPFYLFLHVLTSPTNLGPLSSSEDPTAAFLIDPAELAAWAPSFTLSYLIPTILVALPSPRFTSFSMHQNIMAIWELYPVPFKIFQLLLARYFATTIFASSSSPKTSQAEKKATNLTLLRRTYIFAAAVAGVSHVITLTLSFSTMFFPTLFQSASNASLAPSNVFVPVSPFYSTKVNNLGEGLWTFLGWNMGVSNVAPLVWGLLQLRNASEVSGKGWEGWTTVLVKAGGLSMLGGPAVATAWLLWARDELVLGGGTGAEEKVKKVK